MLWLQLKMLEILDRQIVQHLRVNDLPSEIFPLFLFPQMQWVIPVFNFLLDFLHLQFLFFKSSCLYTLHWLLQKTYTKNGGRLKEDECVSLPLTACCLALWVFPAMGYLIPQAWKHQRQGTRRHRCFNSKWKSSAYLHCSTIVEKDSNY